MVSRMRRTLLALAGCSGLLAGCGAGGTPGCVGTDSVSASPATATADHAAAPPGNEQQFSVVEGESFSNASGICAVPAVVRLVYPVWTSPDPLNITISSANDASNGLAVCKNATAGPVTLTATSGTGATALTASVQLTCK
jgi:hypothetical protein